MAGPDLAPADWSGASTPGGAAEAGAAAGPRPVERPAAAVVGVAVLPGARSVSASTTDQVILEGEVQIIAGSLDPSAAPDPDHQHGEHQTLEHQLVTESETCGEFP